MTPTHFTKMFPMHKIVWKTNFDYKITSVTVYATYSDGRQEKYSFSLGGNFDKIPVTRLQKMNGGIKATYVKVINAYQECDEWFSFKEGYGIMSFPEAQKKIEQVYQELMSKDYFGDVFFTFKASIKLTL